MPLLPLDGPSSQLAVSITTATVVEAKVGGSALSERKNLTIQPTNGDLYVYFGDGTSTPSAATVALDGLIVYEGEKNTYEASESQKIYVLAINATTKTIIVERA